MSELSDNVAAVPRGSLEILGEHWWLNRDGLTAIHLSLERGDKTVEVLFRGKVIARDAFGEDLHPVHGMMRGLEIALFKNSAIIPWDFNPYCLRLVCLHANSGWDLSYLPERGVDDDGERSVMAILHGPKGWQWSLFGFWDRTNHPSAEDAFRALLEHFLHNGFLV